MCNAIKSIIFLKYKIYYKTPRKSIYCFHNDLISTYFFCIYTRKYNWDWAQVL